QRWLASGRRGRVPPCRRHDVRPTTNVVPTAPRGGMLASRSGFEALKCRGFGFHPDRAAARRRAGGDFSGRRGGWKGSATPRWFQVVIALGTVITLMRMPPIRDLAVQRATASCSLESSLAHDRG